MVPATPLRLFMALSVARQIRQGLSCPDKQAILGRRFTVKKSYDNPVAEVVKFEYKDQVVAASGCYPIVSNQGTVDEGCKTEGSTTGWTK